jgi:trehalose-phosphatase
MVVKVLGLDYPRHISEEVDLLARALGGAGRVFLFLDYDGTLVPGTPEPGLRPASHVRRRLEQLCKVRSFSVFVVSGRTVAELDELLEVPGLGLIGQRGFEIRVPGRPIVYPVSGDTTDELVQRLELEAHRFLGAYPDIEFENRGFALTVHMRCSDMSVRRDVTQRFVAIVRELDTRRRLEIFYRDGALEAGVGGWHKGDAVSHVLKGAEADEALAVYVGDDVTDEDAFEAVASWGDDGSSEMSWTLPDDGEEDEEVPRSLTILVAKEPRPTRASLFVRGPEEVHEFLSSLAAIASALL